MTAPAQAPAPLPEPPVAPLRRNRPFQLLWSSGLCTMLGMEAVAVAFPLVIVTVTGSPAQAGLYGLVLMLAMASGILPAGNVADRFDPRTVLLCSDGCRLVAVASIAIAAGVGRLSIGHVAAAAAVMGAAQAFSGTALLVLLRAVVAPGQLAAALAREGVRTSSARLAGPPLGGLLYGLGSALPFLAHLLLQAVSWVCVFQIRMPQQHRTEARQEPPSGPGGRVRQAFAGVEALWRTRPVRSSVLLMAALNVCAAPVPLITIVILTEQSVPPAAIGMTLASLAAGALAGTWLVRPLCQLLAPGPLLLVMIALQVPILGGLLLPLGRYWVMVVLGVSALPIPALRVALQLLIYRRTPQETNGRAIAAMFLFLNAGCAAGIGLAGVSLEHLGAAGALLVLLGTLAAAVAALAGDPQLRSLPWPEPEQDHQQPAIRRRTTRCRPAGSPR